MVPPNRRTDPRHPDACLRWALVGTLIAVSMACTLGPTPPALPRAIQLPSAEPGSGEPDPSEPVSEAPPSSVPAATPAPEPTVVVVRPTPIVIVTDDDDNDDEPDEPDDPDEPVDGDDPDD